MNNKSSKKSTNFWILYSLLFIILYIPNYLKNNYLKSPATKSNNEDLINQLDKAILAIGNNERKEALELIHNVMIKLVKAK